MGVNGLFTFMFNNGNLTKIELKNTTLIIDGDNLCYYLYSNTKGTSAFGGDYDDFYAVVADFLENLKKCNIKPIILMDGGTEEKKIRKKEERRQERFKVINKFSLGCQNSLVGPIFLYDVFTTAVKNMNVYIHRTKFEADREIALLAKSSDCPVLSNDSDFYCFNVQFIPLSMFSMSAQLSHGEFCMPCSIFCEENFLKVFPSLSHEHISIMATVLGNDFVSPALFQKLFENCQLLSTNDIDKGQDNNSTRKIKALLCWLQENTLENAIKEITNIFPELKNEVLESFDENIKLYDLNIEMPVPFFIKDTTARKQEIFKKVESCDLGSFFIDMERLNVYKLALQIEDPQQGSTHNLSLPIISEIYGYLEPEKPLETEVNLSKQLLYPTNKGMLDVLEITDSELEVANRFPGWELYIISLIYCSKNMPISPAYWHAILLTLTINSIVHELTNLWDSKFTEKDVTSLQKFVFHHKRVHHSSKKNYDVSVVHTLNTFQSVLYHLNLLVDISGGPYKPVDVSKVYTGTLAYNFYHIFRSRPSIEDYINTFLTIPNIRDLYLNFSQNFVNLWRRRPLKQRVVIPKKKV